MYYIRFLFFVLFFTYLSTPLFSQKIIAFDKRGKVKRIKYYANEFIRLKTIEGEKIEGEITLIKDSSFFVGAKEVRLSSVAKVYNTQKLYGVALLGQISLTAGALYFPLDSFNRLINDDDPLVSEKSAIISASFLGFGLLCTRIANKRYPISKKRPLKIIDLSI